MFRHASNGHLAKDLVEHARAAAEVSTANLLERIEGLLAGLEARLLERVADRQSLDGDVAKLAREVRSMLDLLARVAGLLRDRVDVHHVGQPGRWTDGEVLELFAALLDAASPWPDARAAVGDALAAGLDRQQVAR